ncbi:DUF3971 domain-containing protein, partial [Rhizobium sp. TRM95111]|uniref:DUF3971 domain-containing protein n=1 Tax=Rhizobium alarense TaxID=2846851 RepID=UPI001F43FCE5
AMVGEDLESATVKQLWPFWMAKKARQWVIANIFGGRVSNGRIEVFIPAGRLPKPGDKLELVGDELKISFDIAGARMNVAGDIPPLRDTSGRFSLHGERADIEIAAGTAYFPSGRTVRLDGGKVVLPNTYAKPLMAELDLNLAGAADAIGELATYRPIEALQKTGFAPGDFSGEITAKVRAVIGLIRDHDPPPPQWSAELALKHVGIGKPFAGRSVGALTGRLAVVPTEARLDAAGEVDGVPLTIALVEPIGPTSGRQRDLKLSGTLDDAARDKVMPGLDGLLAGPVGFEMEMVGTGNQKITADLDRATVSVPWLGWSKGRDIAAKARFELETAAGVARLKGFDFGGDGFSVRGEMVFDGQTLRSASFDRVRLSAQDDLQLTVERGDGGYRIRARGDLADVRPVIGRLKEPASGGGATGDRTAVTLDAKLGQVTGFNGETLSNVEMAYSAVGSDVNAIQLSAVTASGQAMVANMVKGRKGADNIELTSGDAGAVARFADLYNHMQGGLLNVRLRPVQDGGWRGSIDIRKFALVNEEKLRSIVSTPVDSNGRSLNQAVRRDIDTSSVRFDRGFARIRAVNGKLDIENGVVRGDTVGATFQGTLRDAAGRMDMTGTFMPAYGLNRLFAELPLIGAILGNGRDRGLLGITFKLTGPFEKPNLAINPLSIIAPGVFRNIFEF